MDDMMDIYPEAWQTDAFVGENANFYKRKWGEHPGKYYKGWNWVPLFFCIEWMVYRKLYAEAFIIFLAAIGINLLFDILFPLSSARWGDTARILGPIFGNALYYMKFARALKKSSSMAQADRKEYLRKRGGVNVMALIIVVLIEIFIVYLQFNYL